MIRLSPLYIFLSTMDFKVVTIVLLFVVLNTNTFVAGVPGQSCLTQPFDPSKEYCDDNGNPSGTSFCKYGYVHVVNLSGDDTCESRPYYGKLCEDISNHDHCEDTSNPTNLVCKVEEDERKCLCETDHVFIPPDPDHPFGHCVSEVTDFITTCEYDEQCGDNMECKTNGLGLQQDPTCHCLPDFVPASDPSDYRCLSLADEVGVKDSCEQNSQCSKLSESDDHYKCEQGSCECYEPSSVPSKDGRKCLPKQDLGSDCLEDDQCALNHVANSFCARKAENLTEYTCECYSDRVAVNNECWVKVPIGQGCEHSQQCLGANTKCDNVCKCTDDSIPGPGETPENCYKLAEKIGDLCMIPDQCNNLADAQCLLDSDDDAMKCLCNAATHVADPISGTKCLKLAEDFNAPCEILAQCQNLEQAICSGGFCNCPAGWSPGPGTKKCFQPLDLEATCQDDFQCELKNPLSYCKDNGLMKRCACLEDAIRWGNTCYANKSLGDRCEQDDDCYVPIAGDVLCDRREKICVCSTGHMESEDGTECIFGISGSGRLVTTSVMALIAAVMILMI